MLYCITMLYITNRFVFKSNTIWCPSKYLITGIDRPVNYRSVSISGRLGGGGEGLGRHPPRGRCLQLEQAYFYRDLCTHLLLARKNFWGKIIPLDKVVE